MQDAFGSPQSILVLGGSSEIALATVRQFIASRCKRVILAVRDKQSVVDQVDELTNLGAELDVRTFDSLNTSSHEAAIDAIFQDHRDIDVVLLAFGVLGDQSDFEADPELAAEAIRVNFVGAVSAGLAVAKNLRSQGHGTLIVLSSVAAERARKTNFIYGSSKAGLDAFAQGLGDSLVGSGAKVMVVRPGFVHTRMTAGLAAQPFSTTPEAVANEIVRGIQRGRDIVWAPPLVRWVFLIMRHLPRSLWRIISAR